MLGEWANKLSVPGLQAARAYTEALLLVLPPNHPRVKRPEDLKLTTMAAFSRGCTYRCVLERWLNVEDVGRDKHWKVMELASYHSVLACVAAGACFALCPRSILDLQRTPMDVQTQQITTINSYLVARSAKGNTAYGNLLRLVQGATRGVDKLNGSLVALQ